MAKLRAGIDIPIIPEDFESSEDSLLSDIMRSCLEESDKNYLDELYAVEWAIAESLFDQQLQR